MSNFPAHEKLKMLKYIYNDLTDCIYKVKELQIRCDEVGIIDMRVETLAACVRDAQEYALGMQTDVRGRL